jgi:hypothetical protein
MVLDTRLFSYFTIGPEEIVIAGVKELRVFAHEPAKLRIVSPCPVFVEPEHGRLFPSREQETIADDGGRSQSVIRRVNRRRAEDVVSVLLQNGAIGVGQVYDAAFVVLLVIEGLVL